ncbi:hypothetical protein [Alicyclobacillus sp.]|uniref:hypothetical protein n=1 Tax=Alicyclobacillus sp. TaxID=61169 RepID=UPI0025BE7559|nr:hypothetical protein [Alicyclobacillus sp.]MCL6516026.1 hypothetical protein [Alicyclobacillus sp.]
MAERTVLSSFRSEADARHAEKKIRALGVEVTQVSELHAYPGGMPERNAFPISGKIQGLASLTLNTDPSTHEAGVLLAADPAASGMSDGADNVTGRNFLLTVVCPEDRVEQVVQVIKDCDGYT